MLSGSRRIIVAETLSEPALARLAAAGQVERLPRPDRDLLLAAVADADALVVRTYANVTAEVIDAARRGGRLKVIGRAGVGLDNIDLPAALAAGIQVVHTPAACTDAVAEFVIGLIIAMQRGIVSNDRLVRAGEFVSLRAGVPGNIELQHQTLGVIGMGRIGQALGRRMAHGLGARVIYHDIREVGPLAFPAEKQSSAAAVYAQADVVSMHVPLTALTRGMINREALAQFKPGAYLVNAARGPVTDGAAVGEALESGQLAGAAIDVFDPEPPPPDHPLRRAPNCILTAHVASRSREGITAMNDVVDDVIRVLNGEPPRYPAEVE
jgi:phosphoglycerate dehydrogenase-like enzyme